MQKGTICLILGGGVGSRLYPLTKDRSKPAVPVGGKYRLIDIPISNCLHSGLRKIFVLTQYNSASLNKHIKNTYKLDAFNAGFVEILAAEQTAENKTWFQGTADAIRQSMHHLKDHSYEHLVILSGDQLYQMDLEDMLEQHRQEEADLTIATKPVHIQQASSFGIMKVNAHNQVRRFIEKPSIEELPKWASEVSLQNKRKGRNYLASMGIYIFNKKAIKKLFSEQPNAVDFGKEIIPYAIKKKYKVSSYAFNHYWTDIGTIRSYFEASIGLTDPLPEFNLFTQRAVFTKPKMIAPTKIFGTEIKKVVLSEGCRIKAKKIHRSIVGMCSNIGKKTKVYDSILFGNDYIETLEDIFNADGGIPLGIGEGCLLKNVIVDKNCRIGNNVSIVGDISLSNIETEQYCILDGIVVLKKGAIIPDNTQIGLEEQSLEEAKLSEMITVLNN